MRPAAVVLATIQHAIPVLATAGAAARMEGRRGQVDRTPGRPARRAGPFRGSDVMVDGFDCCFNRLGPGRILR